MKIYTKLRTEWASEVYSEWFSAVEWMGRILFHIQFQFQFSIFHTLLDTLRRKHKTNFKVWKHINLCHTWRLRLRATSVTILSFRSQFSFSFFSLSVFFFAVRFSRCLSFFLSLTAFFIIKCWHKNSNRIKPRQFLAHNVGRKCRFLNAIVIAWKWYFLHFFSLSLSGLLSYSVSFHEKVMTISKNSSNRTNKQNQRKVYEKREKTSKLHDLNLRV